LLIDIKLHILKKHIYSKLFN